MRKWAALLTVLFLSSCEMMDILFYDAESYRFNAAETFTTAPQVFDWTFRNIAYANTDWALPEETYNSRKGDCKNAALLCMYFLHVQLGADVQMVVVRPKPTDGNIGHALVRVNGQLFDPYDSSARWETPWTWEAHPAATFLYEYTYREAILRAK